MDVPLPVGPDEEKALAALADEADCMSNWTGSPPLRVLDELAAFDAMRRFLEVWWEVGGRSEDNIANILSSTGRTMGLDDSAPQGAPLDRALWEDWRNAVSLVLRNGSAPNKDPLANGS